MRNTVFWLGNMKGKVLSEDLDGDGKLWTGCI